MVRLNYVHDFLSIGLLGKYFSSLVLKISGVHLYLNVKIYVHQSYELLHEVFIDHSPNLDKSKSILVKTNQPECIIHKWWITINKHINYLCIAVVKKNKPQQSWGMMLHINVV